MTSGHLPADDWGKAACAWEPGLFSVRINECENIDRLRAAAEAEANRINQPTRPERIAAINARIKEVESRGG